MLDEQFLRELTRVVWSTVLGLEADEGAPGTKEVEDLTTSVDISGAWEGTVSLSFSRSLGRTLAAAMLQCPESEATPAIVDDVVAELANVIGGNVKGVLPGPCLLSLPRVEPDHATGLDEDGDTRVWFDCGGYPFSVTVRSRHSETRSSS